MTGPERRVEGAASRRHKEDARGLTEEERQRLQTLQRRDREVRLHEQAHISAAAGLAQGAPKYTLVMGPDGQMYAIGGHVFLDTSPEPTAEETVEKAKRIRAAALAPGDPSPQDLRIAARASMMEMKARGELAANEMTAPAGAAGPEGVMSPGGREVAGEEAPAGYAHAHVASERFQDPGHLADCSHCQEHAFSGRFRPPAHTLFGIA